MKTIIRLITIALVGGWAAQAGAEILVDVDYEVSQGYGSTNGWPIHGFDHAYGVASITDSDDSTNNDLDLFHIDQNNVRTGSQAVRVAIRPGPPVGNWANYNCNFNLATRSNLNEATGPLRLSWSVYLANPVNDIRMNGFGGGGIGTFSELWQVRIYHDGQYGEVNLEHDGPVERDEGAARTGWYDFAMTLDLTLATNQILSVQFRRPAATAFTELLPSPSSFKGGTVASFLNRLTFRIENKVDLDTAFDSIRVETVPVQAALTAAAVDDTAAINFLSDPNTTYELQYADLADTNNWFGTGALADGHGGNILLYDPEGHSTSRVYRVVER